MTNPADSLLRIDSLRRAAEQLFLQGAHFGPADAGGTLQTLPPPATAADLFGRASALAAETSGATAAPGLTSDALFQCLVLALAIAYVLLIHRHTADIFALFSRTPTASASVTDTRGGSGFSHFLNSTGLTGLLLAGLLCVKYAGLFSSGGTLPAPAAAGASLIATSALLLLTVVQTGMLWLIGSVTRTHDFTGELTYLRRTTFAILAITTAPALLFFVLAPEGTGRWWEYIIAAEAVVVGLFFLRKTLALFLSKKISILHWFLYLCIVEIFPVSLLWLLITRQ